MAGFGWSVERVFFLRNRRGRRPGGTRKGPYSRGDHEHSLVYLYYERPQYGQGYRLRNLRWCRGNAVLLHHVSWHAREPPQRGPQVNQIFARPALLVQGLVRAIPVRLRYLSDSHVLLQFPLLACNQAPTKRFLAFC